MNIITIKSEVTGKIYEGTDYTKLLKQCEEDDLAFMKNKSVSEKEASAVSSRKAYAKAVQKADKLVEEAKNKLTEAKKAVSEKVAKDNKELAEKYNNLYNEYQAKLNDLTKLRAQYKEDYDKMLKPAREAVEKAEKERFQAVVAFNDEFGPYQYQVRYTGKDAIKEWEKIRSSFGFDEFEDFTKNLFRFF